MEKKKNIGLIWGLFVIIVLLLGLVAYLGYNLYSKKDLTNDVNNNDNSSTTTTTINNGVNEIETEVLKGENTELSKIVNDYIATLDKTEVEKEYNITKIAHVISMGSDGEGSSYDVVLYFYINDKKLELNGNMNDFDELSIRNFKNNKTFIESLNNAISISKFNDVSDNNNYYFVGVSVMGNGVAIEGINTHYIMDKNFNKITQINAMPGTMIWNKDGSSILSKKEINAELKDNKIYSLSWENYGNSCDFAEFETYMENGQVKQNKIRVFKDAEIDAAGEKC